jgi:uracil-DNA glycosylase
MIVGEAWGEQESFVGRPFIGKSGQELTRMLREAGIERNECLLTNVLALRPPDNKVENLCGSKTTVGPGYQTPPIRQGKYLLPEYLGEVDRLKQEILATNPTLIIALGNTACWALLGSSRIGAIRGVATSCTLVPGIKLIPTYHPAGVMRNWAWRVIVIADLMKARREVEFPEIRRPERTVLVRPTLDEINQWAYVMKHEALAVDIETAARQITMIGFARSAAEAIVIPFVDSRRPDYSYWESQTQELVAWRMVKDLLELPCPKIFQNGLYDLQFLLRMGLRPKNCISDTMLLHHSLYPELQKGLGFLGSIYSNEAAWKLMREDESNKRDE